LSFEVANAAPEDLLRLADLSTTVFRPGASEKDLMLHDFPHLFNPANARNLYYVQDGGRPVSMAGVVESTCLVDGCNLSVASIGSVCTLPDYRGRNIATQILAKVFHDLEERRTALALISGGGPLYLNFGCVTGGSQLLATWNGEADAETASEAETRRVPAGERASSVSRVLPLYRHERFRFRRSQGFMTAALDSGRFRDPRYSQELFEVKFGGTTVAYFVAQVNKKSGSNMFVTEWAGARSAFAVGLKKAMEWFKAEKAVFRVQPTDDEMLYLLSRLDIKTVTVPVQGTIRPTNVAAIIEELQPLMGERLGGKVALVEESQEEWKLSGPFGHKTVHGRASLTQWLFGSSDDGLGIPLMSTDDMNYV
jgi:hypothetical protein